MAERKTQLMGMVIMVTKLWGDSLGYNTAAADLMPGARESSGAESVGWNLWTPNNQEAE